uniref:Uncharacterized protein n=1 Tax=Accipiter nisus TaxID=211598 RepID=A0A8B9NFT3_9AVES
LMQKLRLGHTPICLFLPKSAIFLIVTSTLVCLYFQVAPIIKERMMKKGSMMLGYQPHQGKVNFFRQVVISPHVSREDMDFLLDEIELLARDL